MLIVNPEECEYGPATDRIRLLLQKCDLDWDLLLQSNSRSFDFETPLRSHFQQVGHLTNERSLTSASIVVISGDWDQAKECRRSMVMANGIPAWRSALSSIAKKAESALVKCGELKTLVHPPIWTFPGVVNIVNPVLADQSFLPTRLEDNERSLIWDLMCDLEQFAHNAFAFELATYSLQALNPFEALIEVYRAGAFPIEFSEGEFFIFKP